MKLNAYFPHIIKHLSNDFKVLAPCLIKCAFSTLRQRNHFFFFFVTDKAILLCYKRLYTMISDNHKHI